MSDETMTARAQDAAALGASLLVSGGTAIVFGAIVLLRPGATVLALAWLIGAHLVVAHLVVAAVAFMAPGGGSMGGRTARYVAGSLVVLAGASTLMWPFETVQTLALVFGAAVIVAGVGAIISGLSLRGRLRASPWLTAAGFLGLLAGVVALFWPGVTVDALASLVGLYLVAYGMVLTGAGYQVRRQANWLRQCAQVRIAVADLEIRVGRNATQDRDRRFGHPSTSHTSTRERPRRRAPCQTR